MRLIAYICQSTNCNVSKCCFTARMHMLQVAAQSRPSLWTHYSS